MSQHDTCPSCRAAGPSPGLNSDRHAVPTAQHAHTRHGPCLDYAGHGPFAKLSLDPGTTGGYWGPILVGGKTRPRPWYLSRV